MTHTYTLLGMTCSSCEAKVKSALLTLENVTNVTVSKDTETATITMDKHIALPNLQQVLDSKYQISAINHSEIGEHTKSWFETYKPILLIFFYILLVTTLVQTQNTKFDFMQAMRHFMSGFFLIFSFFKLLNIKGFAESYVMYDVLAKKIPAWAYLYVFIELGLGIAFLINFNPILTNSLTVLVMSISIIGVLQSVLNKKENSMCMFGSSFQFTHEYCNYY